MDTIYERFLPEVEEAFLFLANKNLYLWHETLPSGSHEIQGWAFTLGGRRESNINKLSPTVSEAIARALREQRDMQEKWRDEHRSKMTAAQTGYEAAKNLCDRLGVGA